MAILIVDDEANTRTVLRELLTQLGYKTIFDAKNGEEALKIIEKEKAQLKMVISDWEMPYLDGVALAKRFAGEPSLAAIPFLLITSDLAERKITKSQRDLGRPDAFLIKPFRMPALVKALTAAHQHRAASRDSVVLVGRQQVPLLEQALRETKTHWKQVIKVESQDALERTLETSGGKLGAILIEPAAYPALDPDWLAAFKKKPQGLLVPIVCMSRDPAHVFPLRTQSQFFIDGPSATASEWAELLKHLNDRLMGAWDLERALDDTKEALQKKDFKTARKYVERMIALDSQHSDAHNLMGEVLRGAGKPVPATSHYREAIKINPCSPRGYMKLFELVPLDQAGERRQLAEQAVSYCPENIDILNKASEVLRDCGDTDRAQVLTAQAQQLQNRAGS